MSLELALAALRQANRIDGLRASYRKDNPAEYAKVMDYLDGSARPAGADSFSLMGHGLVLVEDARRSVTAPPPPPPPSSVTYPASYFTGPLGNLNPVPPKKGAFLGTWLSMPGGSAITWDQFKQRVPQREADMGRKYDFIMIADEEPYWGEQRMQWIHDHGSIPCVANFTLNGAYGGGAFTIPQVASGAADAVIDKHATFWGAKDFPIIVRLMHEHDDPNAWGHSAVGQETTWIQAWRRIVDRFKAKGADNVGFWWCPNEGVRRSTIMASYPGDAYVDWVGTDNYNFQMTGGGGYSTPRHPGWAEFWELFNYNEVGGGDNPGLASQHDNWGPRKPFVVGETNTVHDPNYPTKKGQWYRNIVDHANGLKTMEYCTGVAIFDQQADGFSHVDAPTSVPEIYAGFKAFAADPWMNTRS